MASAQERSEHLRKLSESFQKLRSEALSYGLKDKQLQKTLEETKQVPPLIYKVRKGTWWTKWYDFVAGTEYSFHILILLLAICLASGSYSLYFLHAYSTRTPCLVDYNSIFEEIFRPLVDCNMCKDMQAVTEEKEISQEHFMEKYAFTGRPLLLKGSCSNWTAVTTFSFKYFQSLYRRHNDSLDFIKEHCQFFPYKTEFDSLAEALNMSDDRAAFKPGEKPWYFGWSNCHKGVQKELRKHYERPYFLPAANSIVDEDWIFMGGPGDGAHLHLDTVSRPSWQCQVSGKKIWTMVPSPECQSVCRTLNVTVHKGDIFVFDSNIWYHSTHIHPGEVSITIGSEYD